MRADEILDKGAQQITARGWIQESMYGPDGVCAMGAMNTAYLGSPTNVPLTTNTEYTKALQALAEVMVQEFSIPSPEDQDPWELIAKGNDDPATCKEDVIACMEKAAVNLRGAS